MIRRFASTPKGPRLGAIRPWLLVAAASAAVGGAVLAAAVVAGSPLTDDAPSTSGTVVAIEPQNHASVRVTYEVAQTRYELVTALVGPPNPPKANLQIGDSVRVFYSPEAPSRAVLSYPRVYTENAVGSFVVAMLLLAIGLGVLATVVLVTTRGLRWLLRTEIV